MRRMINCCSEESHKRAAVIGIIAWCIAMLIAIASFLPADVLGEELSDTQRQLIEKLNPYIGEDKSKFLAVYGETGSIDVVEQCVPFHGGDKCFEFTRYLYRITDLPGHILMFVVHNANDKVTGWFVLPAEEIMPQGSDGLNDNPFQRHFK